MQPAANDRRAAFVATNDYFIRRSFFTDVKVAAPLSG